MKNFLFFSTAVLVFAGCSSTPSTPGSDTDNERFRREVLTKEVNEENDVGRLMAAKLLGHFGAYNSNKEALKYLNLVGQTVARQVGRPELTFKFGILDTEEVNAFATPGGYVFVTRGLLTVLKNESELATVLGHEIAHINEKHMFLEIKKKSEVSAGETLTRIMSRGGSDVGANLAKLVEEGMQKLIETGYGKEKEYEADATGMMYASSIGYDPAAMAAVVERLKAGAGAGNLKVSKTHPPVDERIEKINKFLAANGLKNSDKTNQTALSERYVRSMAMVSKPAVK